ncbi:MAG TPA: CHAP domain-containing protein [Rhizomicrobium sp.]|nr:CHAP domain-containing protein [Rhizomicrobium sp.]
MGSFVRLAAAALFCAALAACTTTPPSSYGYDRDYGTVARPAPRSPGSVLQCVPYAREHSGIALYGDAWTWWDQADGRYARAPTPSQGSVLVLFNYAGSERAHLAVVRDILDSRTIRVDHANWLDDGAIFVNDPVRDVSPDNDWSQVRVFNFRTGAWGARNYPVQGFIGPGPDASPVLTASAPAPTRTRLAQRPVPPAEADGPEPAQHDYVADLLQSDPAFDDGQSEPPPDDDTQQ